MVSKRVWFVMLAVLALAACGGDEGDEGGTSGQGGAGGTSGEGGASGTSGEGGTGGGATSNDVGPEGICARVAAIQCAAQEDCCTAPEQTVADCMEDALDNCEDLAAIANDDRVGYDRAAMKAALDDYQMRAAACDTSIAERAVGGFASAFKGTVAAGGDCLPEGGAEPEDFNDLGAALASCMNNATTACLPSATTWTCTARGGADSPCFTDINCQDGLYCDTTEAEAVGDGACKARKAADATCSTANECESFVCTSSGSCAAGNDVQAVFCY